MGHTLKVPFLDLSLQHRALREEISRVVEQTLSRGISFGAALDEFERDFARYCDCEHAIGVIPGPAALSFSPSSVGVGPGDEVITVPNSFIATVDSILYTGANVVLVDVDPKTFSSIHRRSSGRLPPEPKRLSCPLLRTAVRYGVDHRDRFASRTGRGGGRVPRARRHIRRTKAGLFGHAAAFLFYPTKMVTIGDGGAVRRTTPTLRPRCARCVTTASTSRTCSGRRIQLPARHDEGGVLGSSYRTSTVGTGGAERSRRTTGPG